MASIQLCMLNSQYIHAAPAPWCLKKGIAVYSRFFHTVSITEGTVNENPETLLQRVMTQPTQVYGFCCYIWNITAVEQLAAQVRAQSPNAYIIYGGPEATHRAVELLQHGITDAVICGEGEEPLAHLLDAYECGLPIADIPGVWVRCGTQIHENGIYVSEQLPPIPDDADYISQLNGRIAYLETSRGCPFSCAFCLSGRNERVRFRSVEESIARLVKLANSGTQTVKLVDRTFNCNAKRAGQIWAALIEQRNIGAFPPNVCFHFEVAADLLDEPTLNLLADAPTGLFQLEAGIQSFHADTLATVRRKTDTERLYTILQRLIAQNNIHIHVDLIAGLPYEDEQRFGQSFDRAYSLHPHMLQFGFLKLLYGSKLREEAKLHGFTADTKPPYEIQSTAWLNADALARMRDTADALDRIYNSGRFRRTAEYLLQATRFSPFELYNMLGAQTASHAAGIALRDYAALLLQVAEGLPNVDRAVLRDAMVLDWLSTVRGGKLPPCLRVSDDRFAAVQAAIRNHSAIPSDSVAVALLYDDEIRVAIADYRTKDVVTGQYAVKVAPLTDFLPLV